MTKPKKWFLVEEGHAAVLNNCHGPMSKPNATNTLGPILEVTKASEKMRGNRSEEAVVMVSVYIVVVYYKPLSTLTTNYKKTTPNACHFVIVITVQMCEWQNYFGSSQP